MQSHHNPSSGNNTRSVSHAPANTLEWPEYLVFSIMLALSAGIGIFYGCFGRRQRTTKEFLLANNSMGAFPTAMSLTASFMSAILLLGTPAEMYTYGTMYWDIIGGYFLAMASAAYLYTPVFFNLQVTSAYQYLELRFSRAVRTLASLLVTVQLCIYMAIVVYAPALALGQVTGIDVYLAVSGMFLICIFYTALGGMKAVMWTDTLQVLIMGTAMLTVVTKGVIDAGGHQAVWQAAVNGSRVEIFNLNMDPRQRHTVWGLVIGGYFTWIALYGTNQAQIQRYVSVPTLRQAQKAIWINFFNLGALLCICCYAGLIVYSKYKDCDPLAAKKVQRADQIIPLFVMETVGEIPGLTGLFIAGVFSGALSTVSSGINALSATALEDFVKIFYPNMKEDVATVVSKLLAVLFGLISFGLVFIAAQMGGVLQAANSIFGMIGGPLLGIFTLGMFFPWATNKGALVGGIISISFMFWLGIGTNLAVFRGDLVTPRLSISIEKCERNVTLSPMRTGESGGLLEFYRISYIWYSSIGCIIVVVIGLITSFLTGKQDSRLLNPKMISPAVDAAMRKIFSVKFLRRIDWELDSVLTSVSAALYLSLTKLCDNIKGFYKRDHLQLLTHQKLFLSNIPYIPSSQVNNGHHSSVRSLLAEKLKEKGKKVEEEVYREGINGTSRRVEILSCDHPTTRKGYILDPTI